MAKIPESLKPAKLAALDILRDYNITEAPINLTKILNGEGLMIYEFHFPNEFDDIAGMLDVEQNTIMINENDEDYNKPFTVAHELGHWILHKNFLKKYPEKYSFVFKRRGNDDETDELEREADCFARNLLIPKYILDNFKDNFSIIEISKIFGTSPVITEERITQEYID